MLSLWLVATLSCISRVLSFVLTPVLHVSVSVICLLVVPSFSLIDNFLLIVPFLFSLPVFVSCLCRSDCLHLCLITVTCASFPTCFSSPISPLFSCFVLFFWIVCCAALVVSWGLYSKEKFNIPRISFPYLDFLFLIGSEAKRSHKA